MIGTEKSIPVKENQRVFCCLPPSLQILLNAVVAPEHLMAQPCWGWQQAGTKAVLKGHWEVQLQWGLQQTKLCLKVMLKSLPSLEVSARSPPWQLCIGPFSVSGAVVYLAVCLLSNMFSGWQPGFCIGILNMEHCAAYQEQLPWGLKEKADQQ